MNISNIFKSFFAFTMIAVMAGTMLHLSATPAQAFNPINCSFYERPGCYFVDVIVADENTFCCYFEGSSCRGGAGSKIGPCWQCPF